MLTDKQVRSLKPEPGRDYVKSDGRGARGEGVLLLKVRENGTKEFYYQWHVQGKKKQRKLGTWPALGLAEAREKVRQQSPSAEGDGSLADLIDSYLGKLDTEGAASAGNVRWAMGKYVTGPWPQLAKRAASEIEPGDIRDILAKMIGDGVTTYCNRVRSSLHAAYQHGLGQEFNPRSYGSTSVRFGLKYNPVASIPVQEDWERAGQRALSTEELATLWNLLPEQLSLVTAELIKFLIASGGQRPEQLLGSDRRMFQKDHYAIRSLKGVEGERQIHLVPFNVLSKACLARLEPITGEAPYPFMGRYENDSINAQSLSRAVTKLYKRHVDKFDGPFTLRDLRRTCKTLMGVAGISKDTRDRIQGHAFNDVSSKHYDRYDYFKEKREGLRAWATWLVKVAKVKP
ncbi:tyrosine-type recombinase/integrase [Pseudomonas pseudonitroreducens]|uniref:tyrosine-type recombinase/integrase n=1 Tax=Pseudomonas pseudonitroreducens TaxID=2892326 RepID=UPI001F22B8BA|nr:integrase family protein [Pseudomonas pseudonitroreducens]